MKVGALFIAALGVGSIAYCGCSAREPASDPPPEIEIAGSDGDQRARQISHVPESPLGDVLYSKDGGARACTIGIASSAGNVTLTCSFACGINCGVQYQSTVGGTWLDWGCSGASEPPNQDARFYRCNCPTNGC
jgi:hypothetical protein